MSQAREKILNTALKLFYSQGIRATGIDKIIHDSEVAKMTFYKHFPSKQRLVIAALQRGEELWLESFHSVVDKAKDPQSKILAIFDFENIWFKNPEFRGCAYINTSVESSDSESEERKLAGEHKKKLGRFIETTAQEAGYDDKSAKLLSKKLLLVFDGAIVRALMEQSPQAAATAKLIAEDILSLHSPSASPRMIKAK